MTRRLLVVLLALTGPGSVAAIGICGPDTRSADPRAYQWRDGFCEGTCVEDVSAERLELFSLTRGVTEAMPDARLGDVELRWQAPPDAKSLHLRLRSLDPFECYRLDAELEPDRASFRWRVDLAVALGLVERAPRGLEGIGFLLEARLEDGRSVAVPLRVGPRSQGLEARILPGAPVSSLAWSLSRSDGGEDPSRGKVPLSYGPADETVPVPLECPDEGFWRLELAASAPSPESGSTTRGFDLYLECGGSP